MGLSALGHVFCDSIHVHSCNFSVFYFFITVIINMKVIDILGALGHAYSDTMPCAVVVD